LEWNFEGSQITRSIGFAWNLPMGRLVLAGTSGLHPTMDGSRISPGGRGNDPGIGWSDHLAFWKEGYPGIMVTDTAPFRYPHYHKPTDTPDKIDYDRMARVVAGLEKVIAELANPDSKP